MSLNTVTVWMWWCGDEVCDCCQPIVEIRYEKSVPGIGMRQIIADGPFLSFGYGSPEPGEKEAQDLWLKEAEDWYCVERKP